MKKASPFTIGLKDKKLLKSSKVRKYVEIVNAMFEPHKKQLGDAYFQAKTDLITYGTAIIEMKDNPISIRCVPPFKVKGFGPYENTVDTVHLKASDYFPQHLKPHKKKKRK